MGFNGNLKLSEEDNKTKCKEGALWFFIGDGLFAIDPGSPYYTGIGRCLYTRNVTGHGVSVDIGYPSLCASVVKEPVADNDGYFYLKVSGYYTRWNGTGLVLDDFDGDLFYEDTGHPGNNIKCPFQGHV